MDYYSVSTSAPIALSGATDHTVLQIKAPANSRVKLTGLSVSFDSVNAGDIPARVDLVRQTDAGTASAATAAPLSTSAPASQSTVQEAHTIEPTEDVVLYSWFVSVQQGLFAIQFPPQEEPVLDGGEFIGLRVNAPDGSVNCLANITFVE